MWPRRLGSKCVFCDGLTKGMNNRRQEANKMQEAFLKNVRLIRDNKAADESDCEMQSSDDEEMHVPEESWSKPSMPRSITTISRLRKYQQPPKKPLSFDPVVKDAAKESLTGPLKAVPTSATPSSAVTGHAKSRCHRRSIYGSGAFKRFRKAISNIANHGLVTMHDKHVLRCAC